MSRRILLSLLTAGALIAGCAPQSQETVTPQAGLTPEITASPTTAAEATATTAAPRPTPARSSTYRISRPMGSTTFATYKPNEVEVQPAVVAYSTALSGLANPELVQRLSAEQQAALEANGFVVVPEGPQQIYQLYKNAQEQGVPIFVTTDAMLHTFHVLYDYSLRYAEKAHFTRNEDFERYFRAMMWYGRMAFRLKPGKSPEAIEMGRMETRQAILIAITLLNRKVNGEEAMAVWDRVYRPTAFFVGESDDYNVYDYVQLCAAVYGIQLDLTTLEENVKKLDTFIDRAMTLRPPKIVSTLVYAGEDPTVVTRGFRFMGQRFIPDSYMFQELVFSKVDGRMFPRGLDVPAVLGSERAYDILLDVYDEGSHANYTEQMEKLRQEFASLPDEQWTENLYFRRRRRGVTSSRSRRSTVAWPPWPARCATAWTSAVCSTTNSGGRSRTWRTCC